jgi:hypothetical protein
MLFRKEARTAVATVKRAAIDQEGSVARDLWLIENVCVGRRNRTGLSLLSLKLDSVCSKPEDFRPQELIGSALSKGAGERELRSIVRRGEAGKLRLRGGGGKYRKHE